MRARMNNIAAGFCALAVSSASLAADAPHPLASEIADVRAAWLKAYAAGDEATLEKLTDGEAIIVESNGNALDKAALVDRAKMPPIALTLTASDQQVVSYGDVARSTSLVMEQRGSARIQFRVSDLFVRGSGGWKLASSHWTRTSGELTEVPVAPGVLDRMAGIYRTPRGVMLTVKKHGNGLQVIEPDGAITDFVTVSSTMIMAPRNKVRWLFISGPTGDVTNAVIANQSVLTLLTRVTK